MTETLSPEEVHKIIARLRATPSEQIQAAKTLSRFLGLPVIRSLRDDDGIWQVELRDGRRISLGSTPRVKDAEHVTRILRKAGVKTSRLLRHPERIGYLFIFLRNARAE